MSGHDHRNDGQHREIPGIPGKDSGQSTAHKAGSLVGDKSGGELNMSVGTTRKDADISTTHGSAGPLAPGEHPGADDK